MAGLAASVRLSHREALLDNQLEELFAQRPHRARAAEALRRSLADLPSNSSAGPPITALMTRTSLKKDEEKLGNQLWSDLAPSSGFLRPFSDPNSTFTPVLRAWHGFKAKGTELFVLASIFITGAGLSEFFPLLNVVQGFPWPSWFGWFFDLLWWLFRIDVNGPKWKPPVKGEKMGAVSFHKLADERWDVKLPSFFQDYVTGERVPSWEDHFRHATGIKIIDFLVSSMRAVGFEPIEMLRATEPRFAFDSEGLTELAWRGFRQFGPTDIKFASNGVWGIKLVEDLMEKYGTKGEVLGPLMTDSAFSAHLTYDGELYHIDMSALEPYEPIPGYARLGGRAAFRAEKGRLKTVFMSYNGSNYTDFEDPQSDEMYSKSIRYGWRMAEASIIASLLSMTNLILHVKDLHLELSASFQVITVDAFAKNPTHPIRRMLDPFISRSVQATNDNFKLLFEYKAADFSLAPLPTSEQLKLIEDFIETRPLNLADMDMTRYGALRGMNASVSSKEAVDDPDVWSWRWHYRALTVQNLYDELLQCWLDVHFPGSAEEQDRQIREDPDIQHWWSVMVRQLRPLRRAIGTAPDFATAAPTSRGLRQTLRTILVWVSWIHEDVGHSAASYVYNPVYTPMCVPEDGLGVPVISFAWNTAAYRGFVFLERATLLEDPPGFWFDSVECQGLWWWRHCAAPSGDKSLGCFTRFQEKLRKLGEEDKAFSECEKNGFYSCAGRVETAVSS